MEKMLVFGPAFLCGAAGLSTLVFGIKNKVASILQMVFLTVAFMLYCWLYIYTGKQGVASAGVLLLPQYMPVIILFFVFVLISEKEKNNTLETVKMFILAVGIVAVLVLNLITLVLAFIAATALTKALSKQNGLKMKDIIYCAVGAIMAMVFTLLPEGRPAHFVFALMAGALIAAASFTGVILEATHETENETLYDVGAIVQLFILAKILTGASGQSTVYAVLIGLTIIIFAGTAKAVSEDKPGAFFKNDMALLCAGATALAAVRHEFVILIPVFILMVIYFYCVNVFMKTCGNNTVRHMRYSSAEIQHRTLITVGLTAGIAADIYVIILLFMALGTTPFGLLMVLLYTGVLAMSVLNKILMLLSMLVRVITGKKEKSIFVSDKGFVILLGTVIVLALRGVLP